MTVLSKTKGNTQSKPDKLNSSGNCGKVSDNQKGTDWESKWNWSCFCHPEGRGEVTY